MGDQSCSANLGINLPELLDGSMDQGMAAVVAGLAGMVGALGGAVAGGLAAVRGARLGAETSARALRQQVQDQAATEHAHWLREQRRVAYAAYIAAAQSARERAFDALDTPDDTVTDAIYEAVFQLAGTRSSLTLVGPGTIDQVATTLLSAAWEMDRAFRTAATELATGIPANRIFVHSQAYSVFNRGYDDFLEAARDQLGASS
ncbi:hypothetical protein [Streptomyces sp. NPDC046942]|uniref:hypothetical protein n=1 Tax=Streptomyces sp. NPDC046942 TaxID=3155137 RepID=UPI003401978C